MREEGGNFKMSLLSNIVRLFLNCLGSRLTKIERLLHDLHLGVGWGTFSLFSYHFENPVRTKRVSTSSSARAKLRGLKIFLFVVFVFLIALLKQYTIFLHRIDGLLLKYDMTFFFFQSFCSKNPAP